jgi:hypothetical protein
MKALVFALALLASHSVLARQYFQCSTLDPYSTDVMVVNLSSSEGGTLFISSGMQNPEDERTLVKIAFEKIENDRHIFDVTSPQLVGSVAIPSHVIGVRSDSVKLSLIFNNYAFDFSCFTRIYND